MGFAVAFAVAVAGCGAGGEEWMPMEPGRTWTYHARGGFVGYVEPVTVERAIAVAGAPGFELRGPLTTARLAWRDGKLLAEQVGGTRYVPPVPLLAPESEKSRDWSGRAQVLNVGLGAKGTLTQDREKLDLGGRQVDTRVTTLLLEMPRRRVEIRTWFAKGIGIVRQTQHTNGIQDVAIDLVRWPAK